MRKPSEYIAAAIRGIRDRQMPDCASTMTHGYVSAVVTRVGSPRRGEDEVAEDGPAEAVRVLATVADFPKIAKGEAVELDGTLRVVTSTHTDPAGASLHVGLSAAFDKCRAAYSGTRRADGVVRRIETAYDVLVLESGTAETYSGALAPSYATTYLVAIRREDWQEPCAPEPSDAVEVAPHGYPIQLKVSTVTRHEGWLVLKCRTKG